tara:strand:- start:748 stop:1014 length:267 start_codon:yes stop_codon:yes gene_type:complete
MVIAYQSRNDLLSFPEVEELLCASRVTINRWINAGKFPPPIVFNNTHNATKYWERELVEAWIKDHLPKDKFRARYLNNKGGMYRADDR